MDKIVELQALDGFRLHVRFEDGTEGTVSLAEKLRGSLFEPLKDPSYFRKVALDEFGVPCWPNGADLAPDAIYEQLKHPAKQGVPRS